MILGSYATSGGRFVELVAGAARPDWCDRCMTSSAVRIRFYVLFADGPRQAGLWWACQVCDPHRFDDDDDEGQGDLLASV